MSTTITTKKATDPVDFDIVLDKVAELVAVASLACKAVVVGADLDVDVGGQAEEEGGLDGALGKRLGPSPKEEAKDTLVPVCELGPAHEEAAAVGLVLDGVEVDGEVLEAVEPRHVEGEKVLGGALVLDDEAELLELSGLELLHQGGRDLATTAIGLGGHGLWGLDGGRELTQDGAESDAVHEAGLARGVVDELVVGFGFEFENVRGVLALEEDTVLDTRVGGGRGEDEVEGRRRARWDDGAGGVGVGA